MKPSLILGSQIYAAPSTWLIEDIERRAGSLALRSMSDPEGQPDTYGGTNWKTIECGTHSK
jgi:hypothetical protein